MKLDCIGTILMHVEDGINRQFCGNFFGGIFSVAILLLHKDLQSIGKEIEIILIEYAVAGEGGQNFLAGLNAFEIEIIVFQPL